MTGGKSTPLAPLPLQCSLVQIPQLLGVMLSLLCAGLCGVEASQYPELHCGLQGKRLSEMYVASLHIDAYS